MKLSNFYDLLSKKEQYRLTDRKNLLSPKFPGNLLAYENRFLVVTSEISRIVSLSKSKLNYLDVGCGDGVYESLLPKEITGKMKSTGIDFSGEQLKKASKYFEKTYKVDLDSNKLPLRDSSFDLIVCSEVLEHLFFPEKTISEIIRVLKPGGHLIITTPNIASLQTRLSLFFSGFSPMVNYTKNKEHIRFYSLRDLRILLGNKISITKVRGIGSLLFAHWNSTFKLPLPRIIQRLGDRFFPQLANGFLIVINKR